VKPSRVRIAHLYPEALGTYGDGGNVDVLAARLRWRDVAAEVVTVHVGSPVPTTCDLIVIGGGEDEPQSVAAAELAASLPAALDAGAVVLAVCAGLQLLGHTYTTTSGQTVTGAGVLDLTTVAGRRRAIGEVLADPVDLELPRLTGFANHAGETRLGPAAHPLATVVSGPANHPGGKDEGAVQGKVVGTYLHGPVLARNPGLADHLLQLATGLDLEDLPDEEVEHLRQERLGHRPGPRLRWR
jgi:CobQ-like glutamine amidotransferase family enzyme